MVQLGVYLCPNDLCHQRRFDFSESGVVFPSVRESTRLSLKSAFSFRCSAGEPAFSETQLSLLRLSMRSFLESKWWYPDTRYPEAFLKLSKGEYLHIHFLYIYIYFFIFIFGCDGSLFLCEGFLQLRQAGGHSSSQCTGLSPSWPLLLWSTGSRRAGSAVVAHGPSRSVACGIFPDQGSNPCPLH